MATAVEMPKMSDTMEEGVLVAWLASEGDAVAAGDVIAQVETDKATMDLEVYDDGVLLKRVVEEGASVPIGGLIAVLGKEGEDAQAVLAEYGGDGAATPAPEPSAEASPEAADEPSAQASAGGGEASPVPAGYGGGGSTPTPMPAAAKAQASQDVPKGAQISTEGGQPSAEGGEASPEASGERVKASPLARRMAEEAGLDLARVEGSGPEGRVVKRDIEAAMDKAPAPPHEAPAPEAAPAQPSADPAARPQQAPPAPQPAAADAAEDTRISPMRKTIARRLAQSKFTAPHFYLHVDVDMATAQAFRAELNALAEAEGTKVSFNDLVTKACAVALRRHPLVNSSYLEDEGVIRTHAAVHVAVAVAVDEGLVTPVVRDADRKGLAEIARETRELAGKARERQLDPSAWEGSTFTTSNLGMFGIESFTAIINPPNACILAIGGIRAVPVVENGAVVPGSCMALTLSCDHRVVDGATGAAFLKDVQALLENPVRMLL